MNLLNVLDVIEKFFFNNVLKKYLKTLMDIYVRTILVEGNILVDNLYVHIIQIECH